MARVSGMRLSVVSVVLLSLTACGSADPLASYTPAVPTSPAVSVSGSSAPGYPPTPNPETRKTYIAELNHIDPDIVHGKEETAVRRGMDQCWSVKTFPNDEPKWIDLTLNRFTSPNHPDGFGKVKASKILVAVRKYLCPTY